MTWFSRWADELAAIEGEFAAPKPKPMETPGGPLTPEWTAEMDRRNARLRPLADDMARVYLEHLDDAQRKQAIDLLAAHPKVVWQLPAVIKRAFDRALESGDRDELDRALAMIALYDARAISKDFLRIAYPLRKRMTDSGLDAAAIFDDAVALTHRHDDPEFGAHGLFVSLGRRWDRAE